MPSFKHSGNLGDIIAALPAIIALGGGHLYLSTRPIFNSCGGGTTFSEENIEQIIPLLESQEYITGVGIWEGQPIDYDLDTWRNCSVDIMKDNLARMQLDLLGLDFDLSKPWLNINSADIFSNIDSFPYLEIKKDIIISRTGRYNNNFFPWNDILSLFPIKQILFVGVHEDFELFNRPEIDFYCAKDLFELASIIRGAHLFIGNQSLPWWLAESMKIDRWLSACPQWPNSMPLSDNGKYFLDFQTQTIFPRPVHSNKMNQVKQCL